MAKRKSRPAPAPEFNLQQTISQSVVAWDDVAFAKLLEVQQSALGELGNIKTILELTKDIRKAESATSVPTVVKMDEKKVQEELLKITKDQFVQSRKYYKKQEEFQKDWDKEARNIAEMAKGMKTFATLGERLGGIKESFGSAGGLKKTVMGAMNVGGIFNKSMERDKFIEQQKALGAKPMKNESAADFKKRLSADFEGAHAASKATKKTEAAIAKHKATSGIDDEEHLRRVSPEFAKLMEQRQSNADEFGKYQRATDVHSPTPVNRNITAGLTMTAAQKARVAEKSSTSTAAEAVQGAEADQESKKMSEEELNLLKSIAENTGGAHKNAGDKKPEAAKPEGGGFLDTIMGFLGDGLMMAFKSLFNPMTILKALGKVFAIGMIVGALFEGIMDGFTEFQESGDIGKALIAGLAGIIDFLTFGLFDKEKIKAVIGDFSAWISDHLIKPFTDFIGGVKDSFMQLIENIGVPEIKFKIPVIDKEVSIGPFYPFKSNGKAPAAPEAATPTTANQVEQKSAENAGAATAPVASNKTNVVNAPVTTNNNTTQVQMRPPIRNSESSQSRYISSKYA